MANVLKFSKFFSNVLLDDHEHSNSYSVEKNGTKKAKCTTSMNKKNENDTVCLTISDKRNELIESNRGTLNALCAELEKMNEHMTEISRLYLKLERSEEGENYLKKIDENRNGINSGSITTTEKCSDIVDNVSEADTIDRILALKVQHVPSCSVKIKHLYRSCMENILAHKELVAYNKNAESFFSAYELSKHEESKDVLNDISALFCHEKSQHALLDESCSQVQFAQDVEAFMHKKALCENFKEYLSNFYNQLLNMDNYTHIRKLDPSFNDLQKCTTSQMEKIEDKVVMKVKDTEANMKKLLSMSKAFDEKYLQQDKNQKSNKELIENAKTVAQSLGKLMACFPAQHGD